MKIEEIDLFYKKKNVEKHEERKAQKTTPFSPPPTNNGENTSLPNIMDYSRVQ